MTPELKETFDFLYLNERYLTTGQSDFIASMKRYYNRNKTLSDKQISALFEIRKYLKADEPVRTTMKIINE